VVIYPLSIYLEYKKVLFFNSKLGSSCANLAKACPIFSWSTFVLGSTATSITGSGKSIFSKIIGLLGSQSVSPVVTSFKPTNATISPALASLISSLLLACIKSILPILSFFPPVEFKTLSLVETVPE
jgi:hypothetical protein